MMKSKIILLNVAIALFLSVTGFSFAKYYSNSASEEKASATKVPPAETRKEKSKDTERINQKCNSLPDKFQQDLCRVKAFREMGDLEGLIREGNRIEQDWGTAGGRDYGVLFLEFLAVLTSDKFSGDDDKALNLSQDYVLKALKKADTFDLETEWRLLTNLRYAVVKTDLNEAQLLERRDRVKLWLHALRRLETEKDANFDAEDLPALNVPLPKGVEGFAGMSPDAIKDPKQRAEYEAAIEANRKKMDFYKQQSRLRQNEDFIVKNAAKYLSNVFSRTPSDLSELENLLNEYGISENVRNVIKKEFKTQE